MGEIATSAIGVLVFVIEIAFYCYLLSYIKADALLWFLFGLIIAFDIIEKISKWEEGK